MMTKEKGLVFMIVLIFIDAIFLLVTIGLMMNELQNRMNVNFRISIQNLLTAESGLKMAYEDLKKKRVSCLLNEPISSYYLLQKPRSWWLSNITCHRQFVHQNFQYIIEPLSVDPCAVSNGKRSVRYYRITVRTEISKKYSYDTILQGTFILPEHVTKPCNQKERKLIVGRQSWRQLR